MMKTLLSFWQDCSFFQRLATLIALALALIAFFAPWISPWPAEQTSYEVLQPASFTHWLGTDHQGRDVFSRLLAGARLSLGSALLTLALILALGLLIGGASGLIGGRFDRIIMRITDLCLTTPTLILALFLIGVLGKGLTNVIIAIALSHWAWYARVARGLALSMKQRDFILAARMGGASPFALFRAHFLPAALAQLLVLASLDIGHIMLHVAGLSFLGLGVAPPAAEWGVMINDARAFMRTDPLLMLWPGLALFISVLSFNILGDALRDRLDPWLEGERI